MGFASFERAGGELLFNLLAHPSERRSTLSSWRSPRGEVLVDEKLTTALLTHQADTSPSAAIPIAPANARPTPIIALPQVTKKHNYRAAARHTAGK